MRVRPPLALLLAAVVAVVAVVAGTAADARAADDEGPVLRREGEVRLGYGAGASILTIDDKSTVDFGVGSGFDFGAALTDAFDLLIEATSSIVAKNEVQPPTTPHTRPTGVDTVAAGVVYLLDLTRLAPYGGLLLSGTELTGGTLDHRIAAFGAQIALGVDYRLFRHVSIGLALREHVLLVPASRASTYPTYTQAFLRAEYVWGP